MQLGRYCVRQQGVNSNAMTNIYMEPGKPAVSPAGSWFRPEEVNDMTFKRGDTCFILEDNSQAVQVKVVSKQGKTYIVQLIGSCGALKLPEERLFETAEKAMASKKTSRAMVSPQLSDSDTNPGLTEIRISDKGNRWR